MNNTPTVTVINANNTSTTINAGQKTSQKDTKNGTKIDMINKLPTAR